MARILLVDDERDVLDFLSRELMKEGYEVKSVESGYEAIEKVKEWNPDVMLLDVRMPGMGGIETLRKVKQIEPNLAVIMVTAVHDEEISKKAMQYGARDFVTKPIDLNYLNMAIMTEIIRRIG